MMRRPFFATSLFLVGLTMTSLGTARHTSTVRADDAKPAVKKEQWKPEDFIFR